MQRRAAARTAHRSSADMAAAGKSVVVVGTGADRDPDDAHKWLPCPGSNALHVLHLDHATGTLSLAGKQGPVDAGTNPMAILIHGAHCFTVDMDDKAPTIRSFRLDRGTGALTPVSTVPAAGASPCHLAVGESEGRTLLFTAQYSGGSVAAHRVGPDGALSQSTDVAAHPKDGFPLEHPRQEQPHPHGVTVTPEGFLYSPDLGCNAVFVYKIDYAGGKLARVGETKLSRAGAGPRHIAVRGGRAYCVCELDNTVVAFDVDAATGALTETGWCSTLPDGWDAPPPFDFYHAPSHAAGIWLDAGAGRVYATNRGHDSLAVVDVAGGPNPKLLACAPSGGRLPWTVERVSGTDDLLLATNQFNSALADPGNVGVFRRDGEGVPQPVGTNGFVTMSKVMCTTSAPVE